MKVIDRLFYAHSTVEVACKLLGKRLVRNINDHYISGMIVETEAYCHSNDPASHAYRGKTNRTEPMFGSVGHAYVYFIYGNHFCFNIVARGVSSPAGAVLIRALEPVDGLEVMKVNRNKQYIDDLTNGPGKLTQAFAITKSENCIDVTQKGELFIVEGSVVNEADIIATPRIGISVACDNKWRFYIDGNKWVSKRS